MMHAFVRSGHSFHTKCVEKWFHSTPYKARTCPHCRQNPLVSDDEFAVSEAEAREEADRQADLLGHAARAADPWLGGARVTSDPWLGGNGLWWDSWGGGWVGSGHHRVPRDRDPFPQNSPRMLMM